MPLLETRASASAQGYGLFGATASTGNFFLISKQVLGSSATTVTFSSIPSTYKSLQIRGLSRDTGGGAAQDVGYYLQFNSDTASNYSFHKLQATGAGVVSATGFASQTLVGVSGSSSNATAANVMGVLIVDIVDYANNNKNKTVKAFGGMNDNGTTAAIYMSLASGLWMSTAAITSITIGAGTTAFATGTTFSLYGVS